MTDRRPIDPESLLEHARGVRELAVALCRDPHEADDVVQETWRVALERGAPSRASAGSPLGAWLAGVVRRVAHGEEGALANVIPGEGARPALSIELTRMSSCRSRWAGAGTKAATRRKQLDGSPRLSVRRSVAGAASAPAISVD